MRFIHASDLHLGRSFAGLGEKGNVLRQALLDSLKRTLDLAEENGADFVVIAGDLFDSNQVSRKLVDTVLGMFREIAPIQVFVLPGTHDLLDDGSVYLGQGFEKADNVRVFGVHGNTFRVGEVAVHGRANDTKGGGVRPLAELSPDPEARYNVAVVHASLEIERKSNPDDYLVSFEEIEKSGMDYVALGHWHNAADYSAGKAVAWYSGSPQPLGFDEEGAGKALLVELKEPDRHVPGGKDEGSGDKARGGGARGKGGFRATVTPLEIRRYSWMVRRIDLGELLGKATGSGTLDVLEALEKRLREWAGGKEGELLLRVELRGLLPRGIQLDLEEMTEGLRDRFFHLEIRDAGIAYPLEGLEDLFPEGTAGYHYVRHLKALIEGERDERKREILEEALYLGAHYLAGRLEVR